MKTKRYIYQSMVAVLLLLCAGFSASAKQYEFGAYPTNNPSYSVSCVADKPGQCDMYVCTGDTVIFYLDSAYYAQYPGYTISYNSTYCGNTNNVPLSTTMSCVFNTVGTYTVYAQIDGVPVTTNVSTFTVHVGATPTNLAITTSPVSPQCMTFIPPSNVGGQYCFTGTGNDISYGIDWDFGVPPYTGTSQPNFPICHVYGSPGTYIVTMTAHGCNDVSITDTVVVQGLELSFTYDRGCLFARFNGSATCPQLGTNFMWDFGDNTTSTAQNPSHTYNQPGTYTVTYSAYDLATNTTVSYSQTVTISGPPTSPITGPLSTCGGAGQNYSVPFTPNVAYTWSISPSITIAPSVNMMTVNYTQGITQSYWIKVVATDTVSDCSSMDSIYVGGCCYYEYPPAAINPMFYNNSSSQMVLLAPPGWMTVSVNTYTVQSQAFSINGTFTVQGVTTFSDCDIKLGYNAKIVIAPGATLIITDKNGQPSRLWACNEMWDGIYVDNTGNNGSMLTINNGSSVEDALNAVHSDNGGQFQIYGGGTAGNVKLNKNFKHVVVKNKPTGTHPGYILATDISCRDNVTGVTFNPSSVNPAQAANTLRWPKFGKRTHIGVEINNVLLFDKMGNAAQAGYKNTFDNMDYGVKSINSSVTIKNNEFKNITATSTFTKKDECPIGTAICSRGNVSMWVPRSIIVGGSVTNEPNSIHDGNVGIDGQVNLNLNIRYNTLKLLKTGIIARKNYLKTNTVDYNTFKDMTTGVDMLDLRLSTVNVRFNAMNMKNVNNTTGVRVAETVISPLTRYTITDNIIDTVRNGITASLVRGAKIDKNTVRLKHTSSAANYGRGIYVANSNSSWVRSNNVFGQNRNDYWMEGIRLDVCFRDTVLCNLTRKLGSGEFFSASQPFTLFAKNTMDDNFWGLVLNGSALIGPQGTITNPNDNSWLNSFTYSQTHAYGSNGVLSPFIVQNGQYYPTNNTQANGAIITFTNTATGTSNVSCSVATAHDGYAALPMAQKIAGDSITYPAYDTANVWLQNWALYNHLKEDTTLFSVQLIEDFYEVLEQGNIGSFYSVLEIMNDTMLTGGDIDSALTINNYIVPENDIEANWKVVNTIILGNEKTGALPSDNQLAILQDLAERCPITDGPAVYISRALCTAYDVTYTEYEDACEHASIGEGGRLAAPSSSFNGFKLYPNPNNGQMQLAYELGEAKSGELAIFDLTGKKVASYTLLADEHVLFIDKTNLSNGIYLYRVAVDGKVVQSDKLVIVK